MLASITPASTHQVVSGNSFEVCGCVMLPAHTCRLCGCLLCWERACGPSAPALVMLKAGEGHCFALLICYAFAWILLHTL